MNGIRKYYFKKGPPPANFFVGGVASFMTGTTEVASELGVSFYKVKSFSATTANDIQFHIPSNFNIPQLKWDETIIRNNLTYFYDVGGTLTRIGQNCFSLCSKLEKIWIPNCSTIDAPSGYPTFTGVGIKGFLEIPKWTGTIVNANNVFDGTKLTHIKYPKLIQHNQQWVNSSGRVSHNNITTLKRLYLPVLTAITSYEGLLYDDRYFRSMSSSAIVYLNPYLETCRFAERYIRPVGVLPGDAFEVNGLTYTATAGPTTGTEFNCTGSDVFTAQNIATMINADVRVGTIGDIKCRYGINQNYVVLKQIKSYGFVPNSGGAAPLPTNSIADNEVTGNTTTYSASTATRFVSPAGNTFYSGGTVDRTVYYWKNIRGAEIRYITGTTTPDAVIDLSGSNWTTNTVDLTFTAPTGHDRPIDFYEVWINDGVSTGSTIWQDYLPHQEISGSTSTVTGLSSGTTYTIKIKAADTLYNLSDFSNVITGTTS